MHGAAALENVRIAFSMLRSSLLRSSLTVLGVVVGTTTVVLIAAFVSGIDVSVKAEFESFGTRSIYIYKFDPAFNINPSREERTRKPITYDDSLAIVEHCLAVERLAIIKMTYDAFRHGPFHERPLVRYHDTEVSNANIMGVSAAYFELGVVEVAEGRAFTEVEDAHRTQVAVLGVDLANALMPGINPVGKNVQIHGQAFRIVGVLAKREFFLVPDEDPGNVNRMVLMPYATADKIWPEQDDNFVVAQGRPGRVSEAVEQIRAVLRQRRSVPVGGADSFAILTTDKLMEKFDEIVGGVFLLMVAIGSVGLLVGGIGVMNVMLVSVTERTREIGVRKAVGARRVDIVWQFLVEAMTLTGFGGCAGILLGWLLSLVVRLFLPSYIPLWAPVGGFLSSVGIGLIFGMWPAVKAANLDPIEALRHE